ncbi:hypothetical protein [Streptomyces bobili]|jgi:hypothetical protein|uniref:hypothetical protein n=1 Tax=Streptomyces bobili TaxID=67280 RepID=UPI000A3BC0FC|nr:hypothetical protein [Streptomyces bobili]
MLVLSAIQELLGLTAAALAQARLGTLGVLLLFTVGVGIRARNNGLAVGAAVVLVMMMTQA